MSAQECARNLLSRRKVLLAGGAAAVTATLVACGDDPDYSEAESRPDDVSETNLDFAALGAGIEVSAVQTYEALLGAADDGALGAVPIVFLNFLSKARSQHEEHRDAWNKALTDGGRAAVNQPNGTLQGSIEDQLAGATDFVAAANLALGLEQVLSHTYAKAIPGLYNLDITPTAPGLDGVVVEREKPDPVRTAGQMQIVDQQRQAILLYLLGQYPVPEEFQSIDKAISA